MQSKTPSSTAVWMILASTWPLANRARSENSILLEPLDDPIASAFGLERRNDAVFHHTANLAKADLRGAKLIQPSEGVVVVYRSVAQGYDKEKSFGGELRRSQSVMFHLLKHAGDAFAHLLQITEIGEHPHDQWIAGKVKALVLLQLLEGHRRR